MRMETTLTVIATIILTCAMVGEAIYLMMGSDETYEVTINEKWIKGQGGDDQKYLMSDINGNVYSIEDSYWKWIFDASDRYAKIIPGNTYAIETFGRRSQFFSNYPNAIKIKEMENNI